jgi:hypothetical protein
LSFASSDGSRSGKVAVAEFAKFAKTKEIAAAAAAKGGVARVKKSRRSGTAPLQQLWVIPLYESFSPCVPAAGH